jgi:hypothetical protein
MNDLHNTFQFLASFCTKISSVSFYFLPKMKQYKKIESINKFSTLFANYAKSMLIIEINTEETMEMQENNRFLIE